MAIKKQKKTIKILLIVFVISSIIFLRYFYVKSIRPKKMARAISTKYIDISALENQKISKVHFNEKDFIKKQDLLIEFDVTDIKAKIHHIKSKIDYENEKATLLKFEEDRALETYLNSKKDDKFDPKDVNFNLKQLEKKQVLFNIQKAKIEMLKSELAVFKNEKKKAFIYSPIDGQIVKNFSYIGKNTYAKEKLLSISEEM